MGTCGLQARADSLAQMGNAIGSWVGPRPDAIFQKRPQALLEYLVTVVYRQLLDQLALRLQFGLRRAFGAGVVHRS